MADDDYWATITFDKPKFPWQLDDRESTPVEDPLAQPALPADIWKGCCVVLKVPLDGLNSCW
jgi:hypothetical protein